MNGFLIGPFNEQDHEKARAELEAAIDADRRGRKFKPMKTLALLIGFEALTREEQRTLSAYLRGDHRKGRGERTDRGFNRQCDLDRLQRYHLLIQQDIERKDAIPKLAEAERIHERKLEESIARAIKYWEEDEKELELRFLELKLKMGEIEKERERMRILTPFMK
jgi:hypothetical protein